MLTPKAQKRLVVVALSFLATTYFVLDSELYFYGKSDLNIYHSLPLNLLPGSDYYFAKGFYIEDEYGFFLINKGICQYVGSDITFNIKQFVNYCYDEERLVAEIVNEDDKTYYIEFFGNKDPTALRKIGVKIWNGDQKVDLTNMNCRRVENSTAQIVKIKMLRNFIWLFFVILLIYFAIKIIKKIRSKFR